jgi:ribosomal protein S18 acetylase RimI-like enzyme
MFVSGSTARRIEAAEASLTYDVGSGVSRRHPERNIIVQHLGGGAAVFAGGTPFDKVIGLGFEPLDLDAFDAFERAVHERGGTVQVEPSTMADPGVAKALTQRGYALIGFENVLGLALETAAAAKQQRGDAPRVDAVRPEESADWIALMAEGFAHPDTFDGPPSHEAFARDAIAQVMRDVSAVPGYRGFLARRDRTLAGAASVRLHAGIAQLTGATTLPDHRRRGVQTALLRARLAFAAKEGCDLAVVTTQPGSVSQQNVMRQGFSLLYARAILSLPPRPKP